MKVVILGGYGVFGGRLARLLVRDGLSVVVAGRSEAAARAFCAEHGGTPLVLDKTDLAALKTTVEPGDVLVDAVGPFQGYTGHGVAEAAIACGAHYLDLSDDAEFTKAMSQLDRAAREAGVLVLSGVSSVPALSSAAIDALVPGITDLALIEIAILPGNRAPRGRSVMDAILGQVGRPLKQWRGGAWVETPAWSGVTRYALPKMWPRPGSPIGAPDLALFPQAYGARSVLFRAGLELGILHHGLRFLGWLHRKGVLPRLNRFTGALLWAANGFLPFGTDAGGMVVRVAGRDASGTPVTRGWRLRMGSGQGPFVPAVPALLMIRQIASGQITPGAGPALSQFKLADAEAVLAGLDGSFDRVVEDRTPLFETAIGPAAWRAMPASYRAGHDLWDRHVMVGQADVTRGTGLLARLVAALFAFPPERKATPLTVTMERNGQTEKWTRDFDGQRFFSVLSPVGAGRVRERFGPFEFELQLPVSAGRMEMNVTKGWFCGVPMPRWSLPRSETAEFDEGGVFQFDVKLFAPFAGMVVHYRGALQRSDLVVQDVRQD